ncbi:hypothetical protein [Bacillus cereus group sp. TH152-1LC]|uniref:hypothetical protein n=1 Tax=Bacillus cereus group sp. TH152-1LC TaxID=3018060 RepID=UPI0022E6ABCE|nr:hypothetical protein [Bacillus cereus group sp. TH152-1LC]MDA1675197.1 hypothetical protein [Bacillus cereus group sp. TH152-1LC]
MLNELIQISKELSTDEKISSLINSIIEIKDEIENYHLSALNNALIKIKDEIIKQRLSDKNYINDLKNRRLLLEDELGKELEKRLPLNIDKEQLLNDIKTWAEEPLNPPLFIIVSNYFYEKLKHDSTFILKMSYVSANSPGKFYTVLGHSQRLYNLTKEELNKFPKDTVFSEHFQG